MKIKQNNLRNSISVFKFTIDSFHVTLYDIAQ